MHSLLEQALRSNQYDLSSEIQEKFLRYLQLMQKWNRIFNLTAIVNLQDMIYLHLLDSLIIAPYLHGSRIIDVGTGAGLPGIPLALILPQKKFVLLDSQHKKTRFLTQVVLELELKNVTVVTSRSESFHPEEGFDSIITRAFASIESMIKATRHLLNDQGQFLAMKGSYPENEIKAIPPPFTLLAVHKLVIQGLEAERHLICVGRSNG